jgi:hypothetical protein
MRHWLKQADLDAGRRTDGLTTAEREELRRLRRENRVLRDEREILKKVPHAAWCGTSDRMNVVVGGIGMPDAPMEMRPTPLGAASPQKSLALATAWHHDMSLPLGKHAG